MADAPLKLVVDDACADHLSRALKLDGFFPEFKAEHVDKLFPHSGLFSYPEGFRLIEQGDTGRDVFIVYAGQIEVTQSFGSASAQVGVIGPGGLLGEMALLSDGVRRASATVVGGAQVFRLVFADIQYILANNPELASHLQDLARARQ